MGKWVTMAWSCPQNAQVAAVMELDVGTQRVCYLPSAWGAIGKASWRRLYLSEEGYIFKHQ